jgi:hypothetical protein
MYNLQAAQDKAVFVAQIPAVTVNAGFNMHTYLTANVAGYAAYNSSQQWRLVIVPEAQACRFRDDATDATAAIGIPVAVGQALVYDDTGLGNLHLISQAAGCILNVHGARLSAKAP